MKLTFIRHGKTQGNLEGRFVGHTDEPLCAEGREDLEERKKRGEYPAEPPLVFVSPLRRCRETASILFPNAEQIPVRDFMECNFGDFEMKNYDDLNGDPVYQGWIDSGGTDFFPGGESKDELKERVVKGFYRVMEQTDGKDVCFVVHGGTIMSIMSEIEGGEFYSYRVENGGCLTVEIC